MSLSEQSLVAIGELLASAETPTSRRSPNCGGAFPAYR